MAYHFVLVTSSIWILEDNDNDCNLYYQGCLVHSSHPPAPHCGVLIWDLAAGAERAVAALRSILLHVGIYSSELTRTLLMAKVLSTFLYCAEIWALNQHETIQIVIHSFYKNLFLLPNPSRPYPRVPYPPSKIPDHQQGHRMDGWQRYITYHR